MKKIVLSLAGMLAATAFAPQASAVPVFARQTGMACSACHFSHFPLLNGFGRSFKASGYTLMGSQGKVEGEHLSIPDRLNMAVLATAGHTGVSNAANGTATAAGDNGWFVPGAGGELNFFFGGKVTDNSGFLSEFAVGNPNQVANTAGAPAPVNVGAVGAASAKLLILPEVADGTRAGLAIYQLGQDAAASFELLNTGATSVHRLMGNPGFASAGNGHAAGEHIAATSARQFVAPEGGAAGASFIVVNPEKYFVNYSRYAVAEANAGLTSVASLPGQYIRAAVFFNLAGFESAAGIQNWSGKWTATTNPLQGGTGISNGATEERATVIDFQMQGEAGGNPLAFYASYGVAPKGTAVLANNYNASVSTDKKSLNLAVDYTPMPKVTLQAAYRKGTVANLADTASEADDAIMIGAAYELAMNQHLSLHYTTNSGSSWNAAGANGANPGKSTTTLLLESFF